MRAAPTTMITIGFTAALLASTSAQAQVASGAGIAEEGAPAAAGQTSTGADEQSKEIVVTGIRSSLASAAAIKRKADVVVDAVSAEDIGRFPDQNVAESLQRITGVQINRDRGQGTDVSVRGLSPDLTRTEYNGRVIATPTGSRNFSFTSLASDFVNSVQVLKSPSSDMVDGGLAATINVTSVMPLEATRDALSLTAEGIYEENSKKVTPHVAGSFNKKFLNDTIGINLGVSYEKRDSAMGKYESYGLEHVFENQRNPKLDYNLDGDNNDNFFLNHAQSHQIEFATNERFTAIGTIEAKPTSNLRLYADGFYSTFNEDVVRNENQTRFTNIAPSQAGAPYGVISSTIDSNGIISSIVADGVDNRVDLRRYGSHDQTFSGALGAEWTIGRLNVKAEGTYSRARRNSYTESFGIIARGRSGYDMRGDYADPVIASYPGFNRADPNAYNFLGLSNVFDKTIDRNYDGRVDATYKISDEGFVRSFKAGVYVGSQKNSGDEFTSNLSSEGVANALKLPFNPGIEGGSASFGSYLTTAQFSNVPAGPGTFVIVNANKFDSALPMNNILALAPLQHAPANESSVTEDVLAFYGRIDFAGLDDRFGGNIGLRYVRTDQTSDGAAPDLTKIMVSRGGIITTVPGATPITIRNNYHNWLPSLNLRFNITPDTIVRFAAARAMTRPTLGNLRPTFSVNANTRTIDGGNPLLKPYLADQLDLSVEHYFHKSGLVSAAFFLKKTRNFVAQGQTSETLTVNLEEGGTDTRVFTVNQPVNAADATIKGVELAGQFPLDFLPGFLSGFGVLANGTYIDAPKVPTQVGGTPQQLPGLSKWSFNLGGYYEKGPIGIRLSYNYRTKYLIDNGFFGDLGYNRAYGQLDGSLNFDVTKQFTITADVVNLTNAMTYHDNSLGVLRDVLNPGRRITAGVRARF